MIKFLTKNVGFLAIIIMVFVLPFMSQAAIVNCGNDIRSVSGEENYNNYGQSTNGECTFKDFINILNNAINWIIKTAGVLFTISAVWGGFLYMSSGGDAAKKTTALNILWTTLKGFLIILCAWIIIYTILSFIIPADSPYRESIFKFIS